LKRLPVFGGPSGIQFTFTAVRAEKTRHGRYPTCREPPPRDAHATDIHWPRAGYPVVKDNFSLVALAIVALSLVPVAIELVRERRRSMG
jgi:hypothetical protein